MQLTVIGCSGSVPGPDSAASSYLLSAEGFHLVLDLGSGAYGPLQRHIGLGDIGAIALSHLHADHCLDVCAVYVAHKHGPQPPPPRIRVIGPDGTADRMAKAYDLDPNPGMAEQLDFAGWQPVQQVGPFRISTAPMKHPVSAYATRVEHGGKVFCYSGDTGPCQELVELARDADLLLCEAAFVHGTPDLTPDLHLTAVDAAEHAGRAGVDRLVLTHIPPWVDPARQLADAAAAFAGSVELATPGSGITI